MIVLGMFKTLKLQGYRPATKHSWSKITKCRYLYCEFEDLSDYWEYDCNCEYL